MVKSANRRSHMAAIFVDYQDLYYQLRQEPGYPDELIINLIGALRSLLQRDHTRTLICRAYADFEGFTEGPQIQKNLYLQGIDPCYVTITGQKNTVDLKLATDAMDIMHQNSSGINTYVFVTSSHDYLPVVKRLQQEGHRVVMVSFRYNPSVPLVQSVRDTDFIDGNTLLKTSSRRSARGGADTYHSGAFNDIQDLPYDMDRVALEIIETHFGHYREIYLSPLLRKLSEELDETEGHEPKALIGDLEEVGAVRLEKRRGVEHDYTVLIVNPEHPEVIAIREANNGSRSYDEDYGHDSGYEEESEGAWNGSEFEEEVDE